MAELLLGAPVAAALTERYRPVADQLAKDFHRPALAVVRVGEREEDAAYRRALEKRCAAMGVEFRLAALSENVSKAELVQTIHALNKDASVHGVLIFRPLPDELDEAARAALSVHKDVDGITDGALAALLTGAEAFAPCTALACIAMLDHYGCEIAKKRVAVVGRSLVVGRPLALLLCQRDATVTICHSRTRDLPSILKEADIVISAAGRANLIGADCLSSRQVVVDVGMNVVDGRLTGDVDLAAAKEIVSAVTPVPGGVGAVTAATLVANVIRAAQKAYGR
ncbi:MAG: bifunctional 5,10-methylenetetrahydrofolate dehydrogenase/5,10-methenyltetrahydrofolate cyclohydrolase [Christensenellales bacterium]|jgi:methylenetetrahydrofolate dehydrogenase (NADP+)/methenyltetrahydrofolate cyclohydrolase